MGNKTYNIEPGMTRYLGRRGGFWHYVRRVPAEFSRIDPRGIVKESTKIRIADDPKGIRAARAVDIINAATETYWRNLATGGAAEAKARYAEAKKKARALGFSYRTAGEIAEGPVNEILERVERLLEGNRAEDEKTVAALLGGAARPELHLSDLFSEYRSLVEPSLDGMSPDQIKKWERPKLRAVANLVSVIGDKRLVDIIRSDAFEYRMRWQERIKRDGIEISTANKDIGHINKMMRTVERAMQLGMEPVFGDLRIEGEKKKSRAAFTPAFVQERILADGVLAGLNDEARAVVYLMSETGLRISEMVNLTVETIDLASNIPHVKVRPDGRRMKTEHSERDVPLVGVALMALRAHPDGFPRYRDKATSLSNLVNDYFGVHGLRPTAQHSLYSLRHTFEDRLTAVEAPDKVIAALMGHRFYRPKYGSGPTLEQKASWLGRIAFDPPSTV